MYLETITEEDDGAERVLTVKKTNYGKEGERILLRWQDGCFVPLGTAPRPREQLRTYLPRSKSISTASIS